MHAHFHLPFLIQEKLPIPQKHSFILVELGFALPLMSRQTNLTHLQLTSIMQQSSGPIYAKIALASAQSSTVLATAQKTHLSLYSVDTTT